MHEKLALSMITDEKEMCPLCMEPMEADDLAFFACDCRYQVCRFCWAKIINEENGLCPACRKEYNSEKPASYKPVQDLQPSRKRKENTKKTKLNPELLKSLPELRVVQPNLIFVVGLPTWISKDKEILKGQDYFGRYGKIFKVEINENQTFGGPQGQPSFSAYITYYRSDDAMRSIQDLNQSTLHGRFIRVSLGTTKYCSQFLRGSKCTKPECMYLHELGSTAASFTKEEMQAGKHTEYMNTLLLEYMKSNSNNSDKNNNDGDDNEINENVHSISADSSYTSGGGSKSKFNRARVRHEPIPDSVSSHLETANCHFRSNDRSHSQPNHNSDSRSSNNNKNASYSISINDSRKNKQQQQHSLNNNFSKLYTDWNHVNGNANGSRNATRKKTHHSKRTDSGNANCHKHCDEMNLPDSVNHHSNSDAQTNDRCLNETNNKTKKNNLCDESSVWGNLTTTKVDIAGEDPVDIDFDPFRESQQGLAELLATEIAQLDVSENNSNVNYMLKRSNDFSGLESNRVASDVNYRSSSVPQWFTNFQSVEHEGRTQLNNNNVSNDVNSIYSSSIDPPPGFEKAIQTSESLNYLNLQTDSFYSNTDRFFPNNNIVGAGGLHSSSNLVSAPFYSCRSTDKKNADLTHWDETKSAESAPMGGHCAPNANQFPQSFIPEGLDAFNGQSASSCNQLANLFAAAFKTASAMLNNNDKCPNSTPPPFDFNAFFNQLCRQSPYFSNLNSDWTTSNGIDSKLLNPGGEGDDGRMNSTSSNVFNTASTTVVSSSNAKNYYSNGLKNNFQGSVNEDFRQLDRIPFNFIQNSTQVALNFKDNGYSSGSDQISECNHPNTGSTASWHLDDPAIICSRIFSPNYSSKDVESSLSWKSTPSELLQQIWHSSTPFQNFADSSMMHQFDAFSTSQPNVATLAAHSIDNTDTKGLASQNIDLVINSAKSSNRSTE